MPAPWFDSLALYLDAEPRSAALNMAVDQALLESVSGPVLRVYAWDQPSLSIGYSQDWHAVKPSLPAWPVVRRWTGGGVVWHDTDTTYSLIVPASDPWSRTRPLDSYRAVHAALAARLDHSVLAGEAERREGALCFQAPALHDLLQGGHKIAGAGQRRSRHGLLHQGSIQLTLGEEFWQAWAHDIARTVTAFPPLEDAVQAHAAALAAARYGLLELVVDS